MTSFYGVIHGFTSKRSLMTDQALLTARRNLLKRLSATLGISAAGLPTAIFGEAPNSTTPLTRFVVRNPTPRPGTESETVVHGRIVVRARDGGLLVEDRAGRLHSITSDNLVSETATSQTFTALSASELADVLAAEALHAGIEADLQTHLTDNYAIVTSAPLAYAQWSGRMLERMQLAFQAYWKNRDFAIQKLKGPLPVLMLKNHAEFARLAAYDRTPGSAQGQGYYLVTANRVVLYDLTSVNGETPATTIAEIQRRIQRAPAGVATVVHEAIHQAAFNRGMHTRYADNPLWLTEGMAMFFETPDLKSRRGWSTIGRVNGGRLARFKDYLAKRRQPDSLETLIRDNSRFASPETAADAYAEAWALTDFLITRQQRNFVGYLRSVSTKQPLIWDTRDERLAEFQDAFGLALHELDREFLKTLPRRAG